MSGSIAREFLKVDSYYSVKGKNLSKLFVNFPIFVTVK